MNTSDSEDTPRKRPWGLVFFALLPMAVIAMILLGSWAARVSSAGLEPPGMAAARYSTKEVVGDLGGMPVTIPRHFANYVEYDGDPGFGEKRQGPVPARTHQSSLRSFGFYVRYPDMAGLSSPEMHKDKAKYTIFNTPWIRVGVRTGEDFGDGRGLQRMAATAGERRSNFQFEQLIQPQHGLIAFTPKGVEAADRALGKHQYDDQDHFVHLDKAGHVDAYIECSNVNHDGAPCLHAFYLPSPLKAEIQILYRRGQLPKWQHIQTSTTSLILSFEAESVSPATPASQLPN